MIIRNNTHLLYIEPACAPAVTPVVDNITRKLAAAWRARSRDPVGDMAWLGWHDCTGGGGSCPAKSGNADYYVFGLVTHSLCVHYVAYHRADVDQATLDLIASWKIKGVKPSARELEGRWDGSTRSTRNPSSAWRWLRSKWSWPGSR